MSPIGVDVDPHLARACRAISSIDRKSGIDNLEINRNGPHRLDGVVSTSRLRVSIDDFIRRRGSAFATATSRGQRDGAQDEKMKAVARQRHRFGIDAAEQEFRLKHLS
jgi:hypothetical protein